MSAGVLVVGAGLAGQRCCEALRTRGFDGPIRMIGDERHRPYDRPPLSKELLAGTIAPQQVALRPEDWYADHDVELSLDTEAMALQPSTREVLLRGGARVAYERLVVATGGAPRALPALAGRDNVHVLRTLDDAVALRSVLQPGLRLAVVGAGLIGLEVAATARALDVEVTVIEAAPAPLAAIVGSEIGGWLTRLHAAAGVEVLAAAPIEAVLGRRTVRALTLATGRRVACDTVLVAVGLESRTRWLAGCDVAALPDVRVVGDAAGAGHWESAARDGTVAAATILGVDPPPSAPPSFWSDQHGVRLQFAGTAVGHDAVEIDGDPAAADARAIFVRRGRPLGGLLLGRPHELPSLRRLLTAPDTERNAA